MAIGGWIKLHRKILEWEWATKPLTFRLFIHILLNANTSDSTFRGHFIPAGSFVAGRIKLSQECGMSEREVRTALNHLKSTNEVTIKTTNEFSIISIVCWKNYQSSDQPNANERPTKDQRKTTDKESKNIRTKEDSTLSIHEKTFKVSGGELVNFDELFERLWDIYPSVERGKGVKKDAKNHLKMKIVAGVDYETIGRGIARYKKYCEAINERNKDMFRWIRDDLFNEEYTIPQNTNGEKNGKLSQNSVTRVQRTKPVTPEQFAALCNPDLS